MSPSKDGSRAAQLERAIRIKRAAARSQGSSIPARPADELPRVSEMQRGLWLAHQMNPGSAAYNLVSAYRLSSSLDWPRLERSFTEVVSRNRLLRSTFRAHEGEILQVIDPDPKHRIERFEVGPGEALVTARREARRPFDLQAGPLVRLIWFEDQVREQSLLLLVLHHILADERSLELVWQQLAEAYAEPGRPLPEAELQFDDFIHWQARESVSARQADLEYWRRRLDPLPDDLILPFESPSARPTGSPGRLLKRELGDDLLGMVRATAAATSSTPFMVFAFTFRLLLERYLQGQRCAFATPATTRSHTAAIDMIGYFLNPVVIDVPLVESQPVRDAIREFAEEMKDLLSHTSVPFHSLAELLTPTRRPDRHPLFQVMFVHQNRGHPPKLGGLQLEPVELDLGESKFDLTFFVAEDTSAVDLAVEYRSDRFAQVWMDALLDHYVTLLAGVVGNPDRPTAEVPMLTAEESSCLDSWQGTIAAVDESLLMPQQILRQARRTPAATAVNCGGLCWTYAELERAALSIASTLESQGLSAGDRIGLYLGRSPAMIAGLLASHWIGAAYVPLDPTYPSARNRYVLEDADVSAVLTTAALSADLPEGAWPTIQIEGREVEAESPFQIVPSTAESIAYILYTSGSTGSPKGVVVTQGNLKASTQARRRFYDADPGRFLLLPSIAFDSSIAGIFWTLASGGTLVIPTDEQVKDARQLAQIIGDERVGSLLCVPSLYSAILQVDGALLTGLEIAIVAGESCSTALVEKHFRDLPHVRLFNEYGPTEATVWATACEVGAEDAIGPVSIGRPIPGVQVRVLDKLGRAVPPGVPGEAWIAGPTVARGYWRRDRRSAEPFSGTRDQTKAADRVYRTGDLMAWDIAGNLQFLGRRDEQIKLRGFRIEPGEIETVLLECSEVEEAVVVVRSLGSSTDGPRHLVAFMRSSHQVESRDWRALLEERLPDFMVPRRFVQLAELPRLPNGKADRNRLREMPIELEPSQVPEQPPTSDREHALLTLWQGLLNRSAISVTDNFFELGGHSLLVVEMANAIERDHGARITAAEVFQNPTIRQLALCIEDRKSTDSPTYTHLFPIQPGGQKAPVVFAIPHFFTEMLATRFRGERPVYGLRGVGLRPEGNRGRWSTMQALGEETVEEIQRRFPEETCIIGGYSFGATMAMEAVRLMEEKGIPVRALLLVAPMPLNFFSLGPLRLQVDRLRQPAEELSAPQALALWLKERVPWTWRPYRRARRLLVQQPWRHFLCAIGRLRRLAGLPLTERILYADVRLERFRLHRSYRPGVVQTPTVFFNPEESEADIAATWKPYFRGPFSVVDTPDPHLGEAAVARAKELILQHLEALGGP